MAGASTPVSYTLTSCMSSPPPAAPLILVLDSGSPLVSVALILIMISAAYGAGVPADVLSAALYARFTSRGEADFQNRLLSAMRFAFGGHVEQHT